MLLVHDGEAELGEGSRLLDERVSPHDERGRRIRELRGDLAPLLRAKTARHQQRRDRKRLEHARHRARVLLGEQLRRRHDRGLKSVLHREESAEQSDDGLAAADVTLQKALHPTVAAHVGEDLAQHTRLRARELKGQHLAKLRRELPAVLEADSSAHFARERLGTLLQ